MSNIDWSKAPEGATHYFAPFFYRADETRAYVFETTRSPSAYNSRQIGELGVKKPAAAQAWSGDGLPPVGASVILDDSWHGVFDDYREMIGIPVIVTAAFKSPIGVDMIACAMPSGLCGCFRADMARKVKTPAQIAAEDREAAIVAMKEIVSRANPADCRFCALYDAGLRFPKGDAK